MTFPMYVVPLDAFMKMTSVRAHQDLLKDGTLVVFTPDKGKVLFVSHQWVGETCPDPKFEQLSVLQEALHNVMTGTVCISNHPQSQLFHGMSIPVTAADLKAQPLFLWYDFFSCPQSAAAAPGQRVDEDLGKAVASIPAYVEMSYFFVILTPSVRQPHTRLMLSYSSWKGRGWCRAERAARALSVGDHQNSMIVVEGATLLQLATPFHTFLFPVGHGDFTDDADRQQLAPVMRALVRNKLLDCLEKEEIRDYRLLLNTQRMLFRRLSEDTIDDLVPREAPASPDARSLSAIPEDRVPDDAEHSVAAAAGPAHADRGLEASDLAEQFMYQNGFANVADRDEGGWSPLCFAALNGEPRLLERLLDLRGDVNDRIAEGEPRLHLEPGASLLHISALRGSHASLKLLIARRADVNCRDSLARRR